MNSKVSNDIIRIICKEFPVNRKELLSPRRNKRIAFARQVGMYLLRQRGLSLLEIGQIFNRDHTTVIHALEKKDVKEKAEALGIPTTDIHDVQVLYSTKTKYRHKYQWLFDLRGAKCMVCGFDDVIEIHHVLPPKEGGNEKAENLLILCPNHHSMLHAGLLKIKDFNKLGDIPKKISPKAHKKI